MLPAARVPALPVALLLAMALAGCLTTSVPGTTTPGDGSGASAAPGAFPNVRVTTANGPASEVSLSINPLDPLNLVGGAKDYTLGSDPGPGCDAYNVWSGVYWSHDGGLTWGNALMPGHPQDGNTTLLSRYNCNSDPVVVHGPDGAVYYSGLAYGARGGVGDTKVCPGDQEAPLCGRSIWIAKSADGGATWGQFVNVAVAEGDQVILDKQWFAVNPDDPQNLAMGWIAITPPFLGVFYIAASFDGGASWTPPVTVAEVSTPIHQFIMPQFGRGGQLYVVWHNFGTFGQLPEPPALPLPTGTPAQSVVMFTRNVPNSPGFEPARAIARVNDVPGTLPGEEVRINSLPVLAVDTTGGPFDGNLYVAWPDQQGDHADILLIRSEDGGMTWSAPVKVNQDGGSADQFMAWVTVDEEGGVDVLFYDRAYTDNGRIDVTLARSVDGGQTFRQVRVTSESFDVTEGCYHQRGFPFLGDYIAVVAGGGKLHGFWADGRSGRCDVMTAAVPLAAFAQEGGSGAPPGNATAGGAR